MDPGLGKTAITLAAFKRLKEEGLAERMLVVAPLRVCQLVWRQEGAKWTQFKDMSFKLLHGRKKDMALRDDADVYLINPEGVAWLVDKFFGRRLPFDTVVIDELTKFKNHSAVRSKKLLPKLSKVNRRWGLTGTPTPNGYIDLFGQMKMLDDGAALGRYITQYRDLYFSLEQDGYTYTLRRGAAEAIEERIKPYVLRMSAEDYLSLPPVIDDIREVEMPAAARAKYAALKKTMILELEEGLVTGKNAAAVYSKLKQLSNGAVYLTPTVEEDEDIFAIPEKVKRETVYVHDAKLEALQELVEEMAGLPLLVAYEFNHDLVRLKQVFGEGLPYLGSCVSGAKAEKIEADWNAGKYPVLAVHPASAGHGLNMQLGGASHICWFSATWDYELYDQLIRRLHRQGTKAKQIINHLLVVKGTLDEKVLEALKGKKTTQDALLAALNAEILLDADTATGRAPADETDEEEEMVRKLSRKGIQKPQIDEEEVDDAEEEEDTAPRGWGKIARTSDDGTSTQRSKIASKLRGQVDEEDEEEEDEEAPAPKKSSLFSKAIRDKLNKDAEEAEEEDEEPEEAPAPKKLGLKKAAPKQQAVGLLGNVAEKADTPSVLPGTQRVQDALPRPVATMTISIEVKDAADLSALLEAVAKLQK